MAENDAARPHLRIGVDLGGTKIAVVALDRAGLVRAHRRIATPAGDTAATVAAVGTLVRDIEAECGVRGTVGIGIPGSLSPTTGLIQNANSTWLIDLPLDRLFAEALGRPVRVANDADCFALSEAVDGAGAGARIVFGVILGTGVGGGIVVEGRPLAGPNAITGEWGHNPLPPRPTASAQGQPVIAAATVASRRGYPARVSRPITRG